MHKEISPELIERWGINVEEELLTTALTHRSWAYENQDAHNERLEFLGDAILGAVVSARIYFDFPEDTEGNMSKFKSAAVSERALAEIARELGLGEYIRLGNGEELSGGRDKDSILADTVEALIAATFLTHGILETRSIVEKHLIPKIVEASKMGPALDWRTAVDEKARELGIAENLSYRIDGEGPDHARMYTAHVIFGRKKWGVGSATSQKAAKLVACENAYHRLLANQPIGTVETQDA